jgi:hypothetical protein
VAIDSALIDGVHHSLDRYRRGFCCRPTVSRQCYFLKWTDTGGQIPYTATQGSRGPLDGWREVRRHCNHRQDNWTNVYTSAYVSPAASTFLIVFSPHSALVTNQTTGKLTILLHISGTSPLLLSLHSSLSSLSINRAATSTNHATQH